MNGDTDIQRFVSRACELGAVEAKVIGPASIATARANGFPLEVVRDSSCDQNYYGVVLVD